MSLGFLLSKLYGSYPAMSFVTHEDMYQFVEHDFRPRMIQEIDDRIEEHNLDPEAHPWLRSSLASLQRQMQDFLDSIGGSGSTNFFYDFVTLDSSPVPITLTRGVWNRALNRIEY